MTHQANRLDKARQLIAIGQHPHNRRTMRPLLNEDDGDEIWRLKAIDAFEEGMNFVGDGGTSGFLSFGEGLELFVDEAFVFGDEDGFH